MILIFGQVTECIYRIRKELVGVSYRTTWYKRGLQPNGISEGDPGGSMTAAQAVGGPPSGCALQVRNSTSTSGTAQRYRW